MKKKPDSKNNSHNKSNLDHLISVCKEKLEKTKHPTHVGSEVKTLIRPGIVFFANNSQLTIRIKQPALPDNSTSMFQAPKN